MVRSASRCGFAKVKSLVSATFLRTLELRTRNAARAAANGATVVSEVNAAIVEIAGVVEIAGAAAVVAAVALIAVAEEINAGARISKKIAVPLPSFFKKGWKRLSY